ncbi:DUF4157 domain-containing protein [Leptolyngbya cf. ectocarpi LEGE 11479]|uniref:DUF4157 domain-containing protein n=1 Tax=Leptolyngbya cf. ectocarpi LEGE 11479 TaxID=1828722 RepID=A0A928X232_LEPEC|nr:DUF4157 domain-containing protein [Leptolyngbya ectocarpi]MBE9066455.1 DUF4157 domain-containing protein [Leptolyngbya cf. ectocarpi LEGE 11479]
MTYSAVHKSQTKKAVLAQPRSKGVLASQNPLVTPAVQTDISRLRQGGGENLPTATRAFMEPRFGHNFGNVKIHADSQSAKLSQRLNARAFTVGHDIFFNQGEFRPAESSGRRLLAHELVHTVQQTASEIAQAGRRETLKRPVRQQFTRVHTKTRQLIQRSPFSTSTQGLHKDLEDQYRQETGDFSSGAVQYSAAYQQWITNSAPRIEWLPPIEIPVNPLDRLKAGLSTGHTTLLINGSLMDSGKIIGDRTDDIGQAIKPAAYKIEPGLVQGQLTCRYDPSFQLRVGTQIHIASSPRGNHWTGQLSPATLNNPSQCVGKTKIPTKLEGSPSSQAYYQLVRDSELEHVTEIKRLYERHIAPFYTFVMGLRAIAGTEDECKKQLEAQVGKRVEQAAFGFVVGDLAASKKFDDPLSTHQGSFQVAIDDAACSGATITAKQKNPQQPGRDPGNVQIIAPTVQAIDPTNLSVSGTRLLSGARVVRTFSSAANASRAMAMLAVHGITELHTIGPFTMAFANGNVPTTSISGVSSLGIDPALAQVTVGIPNVSDWVISQVQGELFQVIVDFGANRDQAYSAIKHLRSHQFKKLLWIGPDNAPEFSYFSL